MRGDTVLFHQCWLQDLPAMKGGNCVISRNWRVGVHLQVSFLIMMSVWRWEGKKLLMSFLKPELEWTEIHSMGILETGKRTIGMREGMKLIPKTSVRDMNQAESKLLWHSGISEGLKRVCSLKHVVNNHIWNNIHFHHIGIYWNHYSTNISGGDRQGICSQQYSK